MLPKDTKDDGSQPHELLFYKFIINSLPIGVLTVDSDVRITGFNVRAEQITGFTQEEVLGRFCGEILRGNMCGRTCPLRSVLSRERPVIGAETVIHGKDNNLIPVRLSTGGLFDQSGNLIGGVEAFQDISRFKSLEREKSNLISMIAHDMKSPIISIHGFAHRLLKEKPEPSGKEIKYLKIIESETEKLESLIMEFLEFSRLQTGQIQLNASATSIDMELYDLYEVYKPIAADKNLEIKLVLEEPLPIITADTDRLRRVFTNVLDNAVKYSRESGTITIITKQSPEEVVVQIEDQGIGIEASELPYIFEPFHQGHDSDRKKGVGLGLAGAKTIVEAHGGSIAVESEQGKGSVFTITLPK